MIWRMLHSRSPLRRLLVVLMALGLVMRLGGACEAMAAVTTPPAAHQAHCPEAPSTPAEPVEKSAAECALCVALPDTASRGTEPATFTVPQPASAVPTRLAGLAGGPAPPPPRSA